MYTNLIVRWGLKNAAWIRFFVTISAADVIRNSYEDNNDDTMFARVGLKRRLVIIQDETMPGEGGLG